ncbi:MAG: hypothetical protein M3R26_01795 [Actinomycetota bacterium]|nr:hypothetical protein [Actinomycetota bacterium]MDQ2981044.1 hypothetical protein [Actinomycetota bacterium]
MATTVVMQLPPEVETMYDQVNDEMGMSQSTLPDGLLHHYATKTDGGMLVFDVWDSKESFQRFEQERLGPAIQKVAGGDMPPGDPPTFGELHNEFHGGT